MNYYGIVSGIDLIKRATPLTTDFFKKSEHKPVLTGFSYHGDPNQEKLLCDTDKPGFLLSIPH